jgi:cell division protein FtsL
MKSRTIALWTVALLATAVAFVAHLTLRFENVRLGYEIGEARREQRELGAAKKLLSLEAATLTQPERVEAAARRTLRMDVAGPSRLVPIDRAPTAAAPGGAPAAPAVTGAVTASATRSPP